MNVFAVGRERKKLLKKKILGLIHPQAKACGSLSQIQEKKEKKQKYKQKSGKTFKSF